LPSHFKDFQLMHSTSVGILAMEADGHVVFSDVNVVWCDELDLLGFNDREGVYLVCPGSNSSYGNYRGGFPSPQAAQVAQAYIARHPHLAGGWHVADRRDVRHAPVTPADYNRAAPWAP
jgi:hypothetical protein